MADFDPKAAWPGWETVRFLGRGSFGAVYEIRRDVLGEEERCALKHISIPLSSGEIREMRSEGLDEQSISQSLTEQAKEVAAEYRMMMRLSGCPNVVTCHDVDYVRKDGGLGWDVYIRMELLTPLIDLLGERQDFSEQETLRLGRDIANALSACGRLSVIHRDLKPQNIFVAEDGSYKLGDFGIARISEKTGSATARIGTFAYMAPEVYNARHYGASADQYSLGMVLYWLLNERRGPFVTANTPREKEAALLRRMSGEPIPAPAHGSPELKRIVLKAVSYDPKGRYRSAEEMLRDLEKLGNPSEWSADRWVAAPAGAIADSPAEMQTQGSALAGMTGPRPPAVSGGSKRSPETMGLPVEGSGSFGENGTQPGMRQPIHDRPYPVGQGPTAAPAGPRPRSDTPPKPTWGGTPPGPAMGYNRPVSRLKEDDETRTAGGIKREARLPAAAGKPEDPRSPNAFSGPARQTPRATPLPSGDRRGNPAKPAGTDPPGVLRPVPVVPFEAAPSAVSRMDPRAPSGEGASGPMIHGAAPAAPQGAAADVPGPGDKQEKPKKKKGLLILIPALLGVAALLAFLLFPKHGGDGIAAANASASPNPSALPSSSAPPFQQEWTEWAEELPDYVAADAYEIEERTLYSTSKLETTSSTSAKEMDGWELFDTVESNEYSPWSDWSTTRVYAGDTRQVEEMVQYRYSDKEYTTGSSSSLSGWELYDTTYSEGDYGAWSSWSTSVPSSSSSRQTESKTQYRYRSITYVTQYSDWGSWSRWSTSSISSSDTVDVETRTTYRYYYYVCPNCGAHMHGWGFTCPTWAGGCGSATIGYGDYAEYWSTTPINNVAWGDWHGTGRYYAYVDGVLVFKHDTFSSRTEYRSRTRTANQVAQYGSWSSWQDSQVSANSSRDVEKRTVYRYRDRTQVPTYHFYRWSAYTNWQSDYVSSSDSRRAESQTLYRHRDLVTETTYFFQRWTDWTEYSPEEASASDTLQVRTLTEYRYKSK